MKKLLSVAGAALVLGLAGCGQSPTAGSTGSTPDSSTDGQVRVVASTDVYGSIAEAVGGPAVTVTSIIDEPDKDPHEYEADARNQLALSKAQLVVENGGGYDDFIDLMLKSASGSAKVLNAATISGYDQTPAAGEFNEHVWYDLPTMVKVSDQLAAELSLIRPDAAATFTANADAFTEKLTGLQQELATIKKAHSGEGVAITEPVPVYLLEAAGLTNKTPDEFSEAIEEDSDVPAAVLAETVSLFDNKQVVLLAYNEQTTGSQTEAVLSAAQRNSIAVVPVTETLPSGKDYATWMGDNIRALSDALSS